MRPPACWRLLLALFVCFSAAGPPVLRAEETARQLLDRIKKLDDGTRHWDDRHQQMKLRIVNRSGRERVRELDVYDRRGGDDENKSIAFFLSPAEVKGTGFLSFTHKSAPADQWLYLPALKRVRQITARTRNESFMGTDLSYHDLDLLGDMLHWSEDDASSKLRGDEAVGEVQCHVIELTPKGDDVDYERIVVWVGSDDLVARRIEFYEDGSEPKKRLEQSDIRDVGPIPVAHQVKVETPSAGSHTIIEVSDVEFNKGLDDGMFSKRSLERGAP